MSSQRSLFLVLVVLAALAAACGSSGGGGGSGDPGSGAASEPPASAGAAEPTAGTAAEPTSDAGQPAPTEQAAPQGGGDIPAIADGPWGVGTATVEISGDVSTTVTGSMPADLGYTMEGLTSFIFTNDDVGSVINITLSPTEQTGFGVTSAPADVSTAGTWGVESCRIELTKSDASGIAGSFACGDIPAIAMTEAKAYTIDLEGTFEVAR